MKPSRYALRGVLFTLLGWLTFSPFAAPLGSDFTYQGRLTSGAGPAAGSFDFQFKLYDALTGGAQVGSTLTRTGVAVTTGLFTVSLNFGTSVDGRALFLEMAVRPAGSGTYNTLAPRQPLTAAPYALHSLGSPWSGLKSVPAGFADGVDNDTTYTAGAGLNLAGKTFSARFGGTGTSQALARSDHSHSTTYYTTASLQTSGQARVHWENLTDVPAGLSDGDADTLYTAGAGLDLTGTTFTARLGGPGTSTSLARADHHTWANLAGVPAGFADGTDNDTQYTAGQGLTLAGGAFSVNFAGTGVAPSASRSDHTQGWATLTGVPAGLNDGDNDTLYTAGTGLGLAGTQFNVQYAGTGVATTAARSDHTQAWTSLTGVPAGLNDGDNDTTYLAGGGLSLTGNVFSANFGGSGGATTLSRSDHNHFSQTWTGAATQGLVINNTGNGDGLNGSSQSANASHSGVYGYGGNNAMGVYGYSDISAGVKGRSMNGNGVEAQGAGDSGILYDGTADLVLKGANGELQAEGNLLLSSAKNAIVRVDNDDNEAALFKILSGTNDDLFLVNETGFCQVMGDLTVWGNMTVSGSKSGYVVDVAQNDGAEALELGDLVTISGAGQAIIGKIPLIKVRKATAATAEGIAGVVDQRFIPADPAGTEGDKKAPKYLDETIPAGGHLSIVTLGSFKAIKVDATFGAITPGCLLTASPRAGYAMRAVSPAPGTVIGKALSALASGTGTIPVMVTMQ